MARREKFIAGLDVGTSRISAIVGEPVPDDDRLDIVGVGLADADGIRAGAIVKMDAARESIKKAIEDAE